MQQVKEASTAVCWKIKEKNLEWLRVSAQAQERSVTWVINKLIEKERMDQGATHAEAA